MDPRFANTSTPYVTAQPAGASDAWTTEAEAIGRKGSQILREVVEVVPDAVAFGAGDDEIAQQVVQGERDALGLGQALIAVPELSTH